MFIRNTKYFLCFFWGLCCFFGCSDSNIRFERDIPNFYFKKLLSYHKVITADQILAQVQGDTKGYFLKSITLNKNAENIAKVAGLDITIRKTGSFSASIVLGHKAYFNVLIKNCEFQVAAENLKFQKIIRTAKQSKTIKTTDILSRIAGAAAKGYILKDVILDKNAQLFAVVGGIAPNVQINLEKFGKFTAILILEHKDYFDVIIKDAAFEYTK